MTTSEPGSPGRGLCFDAARPQRKSRFTSCCPVPGPAPSALSPSHYVHVDGETNLTSLFQRTITWNKVVRLEKCTSSGCMPAPPPPPECEPREGRRHTWFIPPAPPTCTVYLNILQPVDAQCTFALLGLILNEVELISVAPPVSTQPCGVALGTARFHPRRA